MANTTNFGWETPDDTDLVKDGAAAIRTLGSAIDTSLVDLKGGTTGQILSKTSNTDMDFTWIANDQGDITAVTAGTGITGGGTTGAVTITNDMATTITAAGDIVVGTGNATYDNLPIGSTGQVLTADTTVSPYKVKWAAVSTAQNYTLLNTGGTAMTGASKISVTGISGKDSLFVHIAGASSTNASVFMYLYINDDATSKYGGAGLRMTTAGDISQEGGALNAFGSAIVARQGNAASDTVFASAIINGCNASGVKIIDVLGFGAGTDSRAQILQYVYTGTSTVSSIDITCQSGTFDAGTLYVYGA